jgi:1,4-alpha-glucan branching enzyme
MVDFTAEDGCPAFASTVLLDESEVGKTFRWTVRVTTASVTDVSGVPTEVNDPNTTDRVRLFTLRSPADSAGVTQIADYYFTYTRRLGARKFFRAGGAGQPDLRFAVWAPNAQQVDVVFGQPANGYIADDGDGIDPSRAPLPLVKEADGIWETAVVPGFAAFEGLPYMYRVKNAEGRTVYRTDIFRDSRSAAGPRTLVAFTGPAARAGSTAPRAAARS